MTVSWNLNGWDAGAGAWGTSAGTTRFTIGDAHVSYADLSTHQMIVTDNGRATMVSRFPQITGTVWGVGSPNIVSLSAGDLQGVEQRAEPHGRLLRGCGLRSDDGGPLGAQTGRRLGVPARAGPRAGA